MMLAGYIGIFHLWMHVPRPAIIASGAIWCVLFGALAVKHRSYFLNKTEFNGYCLVILDVILEAALIPAHDHYGFYLCALAFAIVLGSYRWHERRKQKPVAA